MNYFFVFQNKTYNEESAGGYLWAPKHGDNGRRVPHWDKMTQVKKGDIIIHSFNKEIKAISIALTDCFSANRPIELIDEWNNDGWRVDTAYNFFEKCIITSDHMGKLQELQPPNDAPFNIIGRGNTGYLFSATKEMFDYIINETYQIQDTLEAKNYIASLFNFEIINNDKIEIENFIKEIENEYNDSNLKGDVKEVIVKARVGHGKFKEILLRTRTQCELCGLTNPNFLIASHIKPWSVSDEKEKVDINNGLLLCPHHDSLFDKGYISFNKDGRIIISSALDERSRMLMNVNEDMFIEVNESKLKNLNWHREYKFKA